MSKEIKYAVSAQADIYTVLSQVGAMIDKGLPAGPVEVAVRRPVKKRSTDQNRLLWATLRDVSEQVVWYGKKLSSDDWKQIFTAGLKQQQAVPGIDGGFVMLGSSTSRMSKREFSDLVELIHAFGAEHQVAWSDPAVAAYEELRETA